MWCTGPCFGVIGLHLTGNACKVDAQGFILVDPDPFEPTHTHSLTLQSVLGEEGEGAMSQSLSEGASIPPAIPVLTSRTLALGDEAAERSLPHACILDHPKNDVQGEGSNCWLCGRWIEKEIVWTNGEHRKGIGQR